MKNPSKSDASSSGWKKKIKNWEFIGFRWTQLFSYLQMIGLRCFSLFSKSPSSPKCWHIDGIINQMSWPHQGHSLPFICFLGGAGISSGPATCLAGPCAKWKWESSFKNEELQDGKSRAWSQEPRVTLEVTCPWCSPWGEEGGRAGYRTYSHFVWNGLLLLEEKRIFDFWHVNTNGKT